MSSDTANRKTVSLPCFSSELKDLDEDTRNILETYSKIPPQEVIPHIHSIRDKAWEHYNYPCIGQFSFLDLSLGKAPQYTEVLERVKSGQRLLDMGCCFGQDIRRLVVDGAPSSNLYGSDLVPDFFDLGYSLFRDRETLKAHFLPVDIFAKEGPLDALDGTVDIIHASSFFHLFDLEAQLTVARRCVKLLKPEKGSLILGRHKANENAGEYSRDFGGSKNRGYHYRHNLESWSKLWEQIGRETGTKWHVEDEWGGWSEDTEANHRAWQVEGTRSMRYAVWRE